MCLAGGAFNGSAPEPGGDRACPCGGRRRDRRGGGTWRRPGGQAAHGDDKEAAFAIDDDFRDAAAAGGDDRLAGHHPLGDDLAERLADVGGVDEDVEFLDEGGDVGAEAGEFDGVLERKFMHEVVEFLFVVGFGEESGTDDLESSGWKLFEHFGGGFEEDVLAFPGADAANDADQEGRGLSAED